MRRHSASLASSALAATLALAALALLLAVSGAAAQTSMMPSSSITPYVAPPPTQLQPGPTPFTGAPSQSGITSFGSSQLQSGVTFSRTNPAAAAGPVAPSGFNLGGASTIPGADSASGSSNSTNSTNATSGKGFAR